MDDAERTADLVGQAVRILEALEQLDADIGDDVERGRPSPAREAAFHHASEVAPDDVFLGQIILPLRAAEIVDSDDVRVMQRRQQVGLVAELRDRVGVDGQLRA